MRAAALSDPEETTRKLLVKWGHASAQQIRRLGVAAENDNSHLQQHVDEVLERCVVPRLSIARPVYVLLGPLWFPRLMSSYGLSFCSWALSPRRTPWMFFRSNRH